MASVVRLLDMSAMLPEEHEKMFGRMSKISVFRVLHLRGWSKLLLREVEAGPELQAP